MPYRSEAQRKFFNAAAARGDIPQKTVNEWNEASKGKKLPEKVKKEKPKFGGITHKGDDL